MNENIFAENLNGFAVTPVLSVQAATDYVAAARTIADDGGHPCRCDRCNTAVDAADWVFETAWCQRCTLAAADC